MILLLHISFKLNENDDYKAEINVLTRKSSFLIYVDILL